MLYMLNKILVLFYCCCSVFFLSAQKVSDIANKRSVRIDGLQYEFRVLDVSKKIPKHLNLKKEYFWYKSQEIRSTFGGASGQLLNGHFSAYYSNKQLAQQGRFKNGLKHGRWTYWYENGNVKRIELYAHGSPKGNLICYNESGKVITKTKIRGGEFEIEQPKQKEVYTKDSVLVYKELCNENGERQIERYKNGQLHGKQRTQDGEVSHYKKGELVERKKLDIKSILPKKEGDVKEEKERKERTPKEPREKKTKEKNKT
jgi:hypothetical protein